MVSEQEVKFARIWQIFYINDNNNSLQQLKI